MANTIPPDTRAQGDTTHLTDHNNMADVLGLLAQVLASQVGGVYDNTNATAITQLNAMDQAPLSAFKSSDLGRNTTTTLANDPDLAVPLQANAVYELRSMISYAGGAGSSEGDLKIGWNYTGTLNYMVYGAPHWMTGQAAGSSGPNSGGHSYFTLGAGSFTALTNGTSGTQDFAMLILGTVATTSAGTMHVQWAQNSSNATNTWLRQGSYVTFQRMG